MARFIIQGNRPLNGTVRPSGNKNEALPALMACLLTDQPVTLKNIPKIGDVLTVCEILKDLGSEVNWKSDSEVTITAKNITKTNPNNELCAKVRASILLLGPMLARMGRVSLFPPGGDVIGARRIDTHVEGIEALGGKIQINGTIQASINRARGVEIFMDEPSVTATENLLLLAATCEGTTVLHNAACEPHVVGLCKLLNAMGAQISGIYSNRLEIQGVKALRGAVHEIGPDFMEVGSFICLGAIGRGKITIENTRQEDMRFIFKTFNRLGIDPQLEGNQCTIDGTKPCKIKREVSGRLGTIYSQPWPAYPTDLMSVAIVAATQAEGTMVFFEKMFEGRMFFTDKLMQMGANIVLCDPHRIVVTGPSKLVGAQMSSPDVRAGMALVMAALVANGESRIDNIYQIERGYAGISEKLKKLGAAIERID